MENNQIPNKYFYVVLLLVTSISAVISVVYKEPMLLYGIFLALSPILASMHFKHGLYVENPPEEPQNIVICSAEHKSERQALRLAQVNINIKVF